MASPHPALLHLVREDNFGPGFRVTMTVVDSADEHGLAPLLDRAVREQDLEGDRDALTHLAMRSLESAAATKAAAVALGTVVDTAGDLDVGIAVFKGLAIGARWYPDPALRPSVDVDVFVDPDQTNRLGELVERLTANPERRRVVDAMVAEGRVFEYPLLIEGVPIDLHLDPMNLVVPARRQNLMWLRTEQVPIPGGRTVRALDLELSIVQALLHLLRDDFADLLHVSDIARMMDTGPDWVFVESFAAAEGWTDLIRFSLGAVCEILDRPSPLPRDLTRTGRVLTAGLWPQRIRLGGTDRMFAGPQRQSMASLLITGRRTAVAGALTRRVFPPRSVIDDRSPTAAGPYPVALYRWRRAQRAEIGRLQSTTSGGSRETV